MTALWTEICLAFPALDALREGSRSIRSSTRWAERRRSAPGRTRTDRPGGRHPISWVALAGELQRDWGRADTVADVVDIVLTTRLLAAN